MKTRNKILAVLFAGLWMWTMVNCSQDNRIDNRILLLQPTQDENSGKWGYVNNWTGTAGSHRPEGGRRELSVGSHRPGSGRRELGVGSHRPGSGRRELGVGSHRPEGGRGELGVGSHRPEGGRRELGVGSHRPEGGRRESDFRFQI